MARPRHPTNQTLSRETPSRHVVLLDPATTVSPWTLTGTGVGFAVTSTTDAHRASATSYLLETRPGTPAYYDYARITRHFTWPETKCLDIDAHLAIPTLATLVDATLIVAAITGTVSRSIQMSLYPATGTIAITDSTGTPTPVAALLAKIPAEAWIHIGMTLDLSAFQLLTARWNGLIYKPAAWPMRAQAATAVRNVYLAFIIHTAGAAQTALRITDLSVIAHPR